MREPSAHDVVSVLGPRPMPEAGLVDAHAHLWISPVDGARPGGPVLDDEPAIAAEMRDFADDGGTAVIDCQPLGAGRDPVRLASLAAATGLVVIASTGFHLPAYHAREDSPWEADPDVLHSRLLAELREGTECGGGRVDIRAGAVKAAHPGHLDGRARALLSAAGNAAAEAGVLLMIHTEGGAGLEELAELLFDFPMQTRDVILCHTDKRPDRSLHGTLAEDGFLLEYDTFMRSKYDPARRLWPLLDAMLEDGHERSLAVGQDLADRAQWRFGGDPHGPAALARVIVPAMRARGLDEPTIARLCGGNVGERLRTSGGARICS